MITSLELRGNNIGGAGITVLSSVIRTSVTLKTISLEWNNLGQSENGFQAFLDSLADNQSIIKVDLRNNRIGPEMGVHLANLLRSNNHIQSIDLRWNEVGI
jgi:Ran GTPase-activating protein (RanGAP) involved in mRNA processing and transport